MGADRVMMEGGLSRRLVITLPGALAPNSLAQDAREAWGTVAPLMVVARSTVLTAQHCVVTHPSCEDRAKKVGGLRQEGVINRSRCDSEAENINRQVHWGTSCLFLSCLLCSVY